jgi:superfamily II DNA or RNA helicase
MNGSDLWIKLIDPVESLMSQDLFKLVDPIISYQAVFYQQVMHQKIRRQYKKTTKIGSTKEGVLFYTGLIPRILNFCKEKMLEIHISGEVFSISRTNNPSIPEEIILRDFQLKLIDSAVNASRGILKAPTGTGKTILGLSLIASIANLDQVLWLCHTKDLISQTVEEAAKFFGIYNVGVIGNGKFESNHFLTVATRQSFINYSNDLGTSYDMIVLDESHHLSSFGGEYAKILKRVYAPIRIGLTATLPTSEEALLAMEALIGPLIGEYTINEGKDVGIMAAPRIKIIKIPLSHHVKEIRKYSDVYEQGVVRRLDRNKAIVDLVKKHQALGDTVLIIVNKIVHGDLLLNLCQHNSIKAEFVHGTTDSDDREVAKKALDVKNLECVIATAVWKEGVSIPSLNVIINAAGGKSEIATLQVIGRGTRVVPGKTEVIIYDFFDLSHHYLIAHAGERICLYMDMGWL